MTLSSAVLAFTAASAIGLFSSTAANAALVTGEATVTIDNVAVKSAINYGNIFNTYWGAADNDLSINRDTLGGTALPENGSANIVLPVNTNTVTTECPACSKYGRTVQATTMDAGNTSTGQIGLSGAWRYDGPGGLLTPYDFSLVKSSGTWYLRTYDTAFTYQNFLKLTNVQESLNGNGELLLSGDLQWTGLWAVVAQANSSTVIGHINLAPSAVPVPAGVWLFGSALAGLVGFRRRHAA